MKRDLQMLSDGIKDGFAMMYLKDGKIYPVALTEEQVERLDIGLQLCFKGVVNLINQPLGDATNLVEKEPLKKAYWIIWAGWGGNHDKRIDDAVCSECGYKHRTVYRSTDNLDKFCPRCKSKMGVKER